MKVQGLRHRRIFLLGAAGAVALALPLAGFVHAGQPIVSIGSNRARIQAVAASLSEVIDALSRAASFKVTYEGARPSAMLFNLEIDTPSVPQTLLRVLEGQNLNYAVVLDPSGTTVRSLLVLGQAPKAGAPPPPVSLGARPQPFATPRATRNSLPPVDDDPEEGTETGTAPGAEPSPHPPASPSPSPGEIRPGGPPSPFGPRSPFGTPIGTPIGTPFGTPLGPRPTPAPTQSPTPSPSA